MAQATTTVDPIPQVAGRDWRTPLELLVLGAIWGSSFLFMRIAANPFGPFALVEVRLALGALVLLPFLWRERAHFRAGMWPRLAMIGAINSAIPFRSFFRAIAILPLLLSLSRILVATRPRPDEATAKAGSPSCHALPSSRGKSLAACDWGVAGDRSGRWADQLRFVGWPRRLRAIDRLARRPCSK